MTTDTRNLPLGPTSATAVEAAPEPGPAQSAFEALVAQYARLISFVVARVSRGRLGDGAQDVEQQVLIALWKRTSGEQKVEHPSSYIYKAAVRETVRAVRREQERGLVPIETHTAHLSSGEEPSQSLRSREIRERLEAAFATMQADRVLAVRLHLQGLSVDEIMRLRGWPYQKARNLIARGMSDLRERLRKVEA